MSPLIKKEPAWFRDGFTRENLKKFAGWGLGLAFVAFIFWPDSNETKIIREVNAKAAALLQRFETATDEDIIKELEDIKALTDEPEPEPQDDY